MAKALLPSQSTTTKVADPAGAKAWLDSVVTSNSDAFEEFLSGVGYVNLDEEFLNIRFPYLPPVANDSLDSSCKRNTWFEGLNFLGHCFGGRSPAEGLSGAIVQQRSHLV